MVLGILEIKKSQNQCSGGSLQHSVNAVVLPDNQYTLTGT